MLLNEYSGQNSCNRHYISVIKKKTLKLKILLYNNNNVTLSYKKKNVTLNLVQN